MKETLKSMKESLVSQTYPQIMNLQCADYEELGAAVDMIKDLEEALYYCVIIEAMENQDKEKEEYPVERNNTYYYTEKYMPMHDEYYRDMDRPYGRMYYNGGGSGGNSSGGNGGSSSSSGFSGSGSSSGGGRNYSEYPMEMMRNSREGRSPMSRRMYMESKEMHQDKAKQLKDLETYMSELTNDMSEMIQGASPEEKQLLQKKLTVLQQKIEQIN